MAVGTAGDCGSTEAARAMVLLQIATGINKSAGQNFRMNVIESLNALDD
jgi:hypothetical protein